MTCCLHHYGLNELLFSQIGQELIDLCCVTIVGIDSHDMNRVQYNTLSV
jgi:hypothetical protein